MKYSFLENYHKPLEEETFLSELIKSFYYYSLYHHKGKNIDKRTLYLKIKSIENFDKFIYFQYSDLKKVSDIEEEHIDAFKEFCLKGLHNNRKTINSKLTALKMFFQYLSDKKLIKYNIVLNIHKFKISSKAKPLLFKSSELKILFEKMRKYKYGIRDVVISKLLLTTGIEINDILMLRLSNLDLENNMLEFKDKLYPLGAELKKELSEYLVIRKSIDTINSHYLFLSSVGTNYSIRSYQVLFKRAVTDSNLNSKLCPRYLRPTFLYNMARVTTKDDLQVLAEQVKLDQYYKLLNNPLQKLI